MKCSKEKEKNLKVNQKTSQLKTQQDLKKPYPLTVKLIIIKTNNR